MAALIPGDTVVADAADAAALAAAHAGVVVRELDAVAEQADGIRLLSDIWKRSAQNPPVPPELLRALSKAGSYVGGAFVDDRLVGVAIAFHADPERRALHSHIAGISPEHAGRAVGFALKQHQRAWALARGIDVIEWTFDPLVARNAHFNITKLGAEPVEYLANFYGAMADGVNGGDETDRLLIRWSLRSDDAVACATGVRRPAVERSPSDTVVAVPADIEGLRRTDPAGARQWRLHVREHLTTLFDAGGRIIGFDRDEGYLVRSGEDQR